MNILEIGRKFLWCEEYYPDMKEGPRTHQTEWWLCKNDYLLYATETLMEEMGFESKEDISDSDVYIQIPQVDMLVLEQEFIRIRRAEKTIEQILHYRDITTFSGAFQIYIEVNDPFNEWGDFADQHIRQAAVDWCHKNHIPFRFVEKYV